MFIGTWWSIVPPILAITLALITKEVYVSLFAGVLLGALFVAGFHPWETFDTLFTTMADSIDLNIVIFLVLLGMVVALMTKSGGSKAYGDWASQRIKTKKGALLATTGLGCLIFVDDYFNCLTVGSVMRPVTDKNKISRAKLAYIIDSTAAPVCIIAPISSWAAAVNSYVPEDSSMSGFQLFINTIPFNLYALLTIFTVVFLAVTGIDFGKMKIHERNAAKGDLFTSGKDDIESSESQPQNLSAKGKVIDLVLPVIVLIISAVGAMIYTGFLSGATNVVDAFANCNSSKSLIFGGIITVIFMGFLYLPRRVLRFGNFMSSLVEGFKLMVPAITILVFAWTLKGMGDQLAISDFVKTTVGNNASASIFIPVIMFAIAIFLGFSTGTSWGTFAILVPIVIGMFASTDQNMMVISVSAVLAGAVCGDHISPISDTTIMSSAGAQCNHINHVSTQMQYALIVAAVSAVGYIISGITKSWIISLLISAVLLVAVFLVINHLSKKNDIKPAKVRSK